ncbi:MAG: LysR family transcriptional regulator [Maritimibacter sp.]|nr:LysR family transcriptional regulator [Maritimibacter sp.]
MQHIESLVTIADAGSIRAAAERLGKSQPALTKVVRQAEDDLGVALFQRTSRGVVLTDMGERVLARARTIMGEITRLDDEVSQLRGEQVGAVHVCLSPLAAVKIMPRALALFRKTHPKIEVHLTSGLFPGALKPLREGKTDLVIGPAPPAGMAREITVERLLETPIVVITSPGSAYAGATSLGELTEAPWIMIGAPTGPGDIFRKPFVENGLPPPHALTTSESYFGAISLVESLGAVCTFPLRLLEDMQRSAQIVPIPIREPIEPLQISLMSRAGHPLTPAAEALANAIRRRAVGLVRGNNQN